MNSFKRGIRGVGEGHKGEAIGRWCLLVVWRVSCWRGDFLEIISVLEEHGGV